VLGATEWHLEDVGVFDQRRRGPLASAEEAEWPDGDAGPEDSRHENGDEDGGAR
jgi:hypothetical protein